MRIFLFIISLLFVIFHQVAFLPHFALHQAIPNLFLVIIVCWCILRDYRQIYIWAIFGGLFLDLYSGTLFGLQALSLVCLALIAYLITQYFLNKDDLFTRLMIIILATLGYQFVFLGFTSLAKVLRLTDYGILLSGQYLYFLFWQILVNLIALLIIFPIVRVSYNFLVRHEGSIFPRQSALK